MSTPDVIRIRVYRDDKGWWYQPERVTDGGTGAHIDIGPRWPSPGKGAYRYCQTVESRPISPLRHEAA